MARIRTVKPELFTHEDLYELEQESGLPIRIAFAGLFTCCDRDGIFKWKPKTLKLSVLPYDEVDFSRVLHAMMTRGFVRKYAIDGVEYGVIPTFLKHQVINNREAASDFPKPTESSYVSMTSTRDARVDSPPVTRDDSVEHAASGEGKGKEGKGREEEGKETYVEQKPLDPSLTIFEFWQKVMDSPRSVLDTKRKSLIAKALKGYTPADICKAIRGCGKSPFHMGQNDRSTKYNGLDLILRNADRIEHFIAMDTGTPRTGGAESIETANARLMAEFLGEAAPMDDNVIEMEA